MSYEKKGKEYYQKLLDLSLKRIDEVKDSDKWTDSQEKDGCKIQSLKTGFSNFNLIRGIMEIKTKKSPKVVLKDISDLCKFANTDKKDDFKRADPFMVFYRDVHWIKEISDEAGIFHIRYTPNTMLVSDRDFIFVRDVKLDDKCSMYYGMSIPVGEEGEDWGVDNKCVRAMIEVFQWRVEVVKEGTLKVIYYTCTDPKGWMPVKVYNYCTTDAGFAVVRYVETLKKNWEEEQNVEDMLL